jgi:signal transduction histidine kinase
MPMGPANFRDPAESVAVDAADMPVRGPRRAGYVAAIGGVALVIAFGAITSAAIEDISFFSLLLLTVAVSSWLGGVRPGVLSAALGAVGWLAFLVDPALSHESGPDTSDILGLMLYLVAAGVILGVRGAELRARERALQSAEVARARQRVLEQEVAARLEVESALRLSERLGTVGAMATGIGHDLGNILFSLQADAEVLAECSLPPRAVDAVQSLRSVTRYLRDLTRGLRMLALDPERHDGSARTRLDEWWPAVAALLKAALRQRVAIEPDIPADLPAARIAPHQLTQVMFNLVGNAADAIVENPPAAAGVVKVSAALLADGKGVRLRIIDNGKGMPPEIVARAFEPFFTTKAGRGGTGLGLALVKRLVAAAGGKVSIESVTGIGTTVTVDLLAEPRGPEQAQNPTPVITRAAALPLPNAPR